MAFSFLKYLVSLWRYLGFCNMQMRKAMTSLIIPEKDKSLNQAYLLAPSMFIIKGTRWHLLRRCHGTVLDPVSFCYKQNISICSTLKMNSGNGAMGARLDFRRPLVFGLSSPRSDRGLIFPKKRLEIEPKRVPSCAFYDEH